jgi:sugar/nucleoside kinase (ribokinase family)
VDTTAWASRILPDNPIVVLGGPALDTEACVPYFPAVDGNVVATALSRSPGGVGANIAVGLAHLGNRVILLGATGDDGTGAFLRDRLIRAGVDTSVMLVRPNTPTHSCFIAITPGGERMIYGLPGTTTLETPEEIDHAVIHSASALHVGPAYREVALAAIATARESSIFVSYTPADVRWPEGPQAVLDVARHVDLLIVNRVEAAELTGLETPEDAIRQLLAWGYGPLILTCGQNGVLVGDHGNVLALPAYPMEAVQNTTGAGDAFTAGIITGIRMHLSLEQAARLGIAVAALKLRKPGAQSGLPTLEEAMIVMREA